MKSLILIVPLFALTITARAQTTNVTFSILVEEPTRTNTMIVTASQKEVRGLTLNWAKDLMVAEQLTNATPSFRKSVQDWQKSAMVPLQEQADADERKNGKVELINANLSAWWSQMTQAEKDQWKNLSSNMVVKYGP